MERYCSGKWLLLRPWWSRVVHGEDVAMMRMCVALLLGPEEEAESSGAHAILILSWCLFYASLPAVAVTWMCSPPSVRPPARWASDTAAFCCTAGSLTRLCLSLPKIWFCLIVHRPALAGFLPLHRASLSCWLLSEWFLVLGVKH